MEEQWAYYYQEEEGVEDLKQSLLYTTLELEAALISDHEEISRKDQEIHQLKALLTKIIKEKFDLQAKSQQLAHEKQLLYQQLQILARSSSKKQHLDTCTLSTGATSNEDSDCDENIIDKIARERPRPEQGKFLQAVMEAGPLLQTLILAGPLPRWQHPPPQLDSADIPPVKISSPRILSQDSCFVSPTGAGFAHKRTSAGAPAGSDGCDFSPCSKYQKVSSPIIILPNNI